MTVNLERANVAPTQRLSSMGAAGLRPIGPWGASELEAGTILRERYVIDSCLGHGGMGVVYKAVDLSRRDHGEVDCHIAIKVLHPATDERPAALARLRREFYCAQALSHENVVNVFDLDRDGELDFFTMEYVEGELLSDVVMQFDGRAMPRNAAWAIIRQIAAGMMHAHERKIVHADLKPQNIILSTTGQVRILDFGAARDAQRSAIPTDLRSTNPFALTPAYASCELLAGKRADARDDLYALACLTCELLAGQHPFWHQRSTEARMAQAVPTRPPDLTIRQWRTLQRGLAWDREQRSVSVREWFAALSPPFTGIVAIPRPQNAEQVKTATVNAKLGRRRVAAALASVLVCVLCAWAVINRSARLDETAQAVASQAVNQTSAIVNSAAVAVAASVPPAEAAADGVTTGGARPMGSGANLGPEKIDFASSTYTLPPGARFAEIRVRRSDAAVRKASFDWWTEDSTALSGIDFVTQPRSRVTFLPGSRTASLFVKVLEDAPRKPGAKFDVVIGGASKGTLLGVSRTEITLASAR